jgi:hypothetical protein
VRIVDAVVVNVDEYLNVVVVAAAVVVVVSGDDSEIDCN